MPGFARLSIRPMVPPMEATAAEALPAGEGWQFEPKWDGFRCLVFRDGNEVMLQSKAEKPLGRYFPEVTDCVRAWPEKRCVVDGELIISQEGTLSFEALQLRLHPAESRIRKLATATPARLMLFDCLETSRACLAERTLAERRAALEKLHARIDSSEILLSPATMNRQRAQAWLELAGGALDGVVATRRADTYTFGERTMVKVKRLRTADCVVGGFRYGKEGREVASLLLGLYDDEGRLNHVGFTSNVPAGERASLTKRLEKLVAPPGFTGRAPGGPSRWSNERSSQWQPLRPKLVAEVRYDHVTGERFRHGTRFLRWRPDKAPHQCRMDQLAVEADPRVIGLVG